jgi:hypothetical protein
MKPNGNPISSTKLSKSTPRRRLIKSLDSLVVVVRINSKGTHLMWTILCLLPINKIRIRMSLITKIITIVIQNLLAVTMKKKMRMMIMGNSTSINMKTEKSNQTLP